MVYRGHASRVSMAWRPPAVAPRPANTEVAPLKTVQRPAIVIEAEASLAALASDINLAHAAAERAALQTVAMARQAGVLLLEAKKRVAYGNWLPWLAANVSVTARQAQKYMKIAANWAELEARS